MCRGEMSTQEKGWKYLPAPMSEGRGKTFNENGDIMRNREIKLRKQLNDRLREKYELGYGRAKHDIKDVHNATPWIHRSNTYKTYHQQVNHFADWCKSQGIKDYEKAVQAVPQYMQQLNADGKSASSQATALSALAKCMDRSTTEFDYQLPQRHRSDIVRSRGPVARDLHFSPEKNQALIKFCESTGLRRRELTALKGSNLNFKDGRAYLSIENGKGGKNRLVEVIGDRKLVIDMCNRAGDGKVFPKVHSCADIHSYRGTYAANLYQSLARREIPKEDRYICRGDMKGKVFDKQAMAIVSQNLGHNRIDVIANNYLYNL